MPIVLDFERQLVDHGIDHLAGGLAHDVLVELVDIAEAEILGAHADRLGSLGLVDRLGP